MSVTVFPDSVTLLPGESIPVMLSVGTETPPGTSSVCVTVTVEQPEMILTGDIDAVVLAGTVGRLRAPARLINNLHVRGRLTSDQVALIDCNGFDIHTHDGGLLDLQGVEKTAWLRWGDTPVGWQPGDRLAVAPTAVGVFVPSEMLWTGSWGTMTRPIKSPDVPLLDGSIARPEVANLSQTLVFENADRLMMHESDVPNVHTLKWLKVLNSGKSLAEAGELGHYPIHFHLLGDTCRGSIVEGVVVEGGKNHALVPHGSHGITVRDVVAYNTTNDAFWWDFPPDKNDSTNNSDDIVVDHMLVMWVLGTALRRSGFILGAGANPLITDSVATCVQGGKEAAGFHWPEPANQNVGGIVWNFHHNIAHNNKSDGSNVWQNDASPHVVEDFIGYRNGLSQMDHGAYGNRYLYRRCVLMGGSEAAFKIHAVGPIVLEDILTDGPLLIFKHQSGASVFTTIRRCQFTEVIYNETSNDGTERSLNRYEDTGLTPADFNFGIADIGIVPTSEIEILEDGVLTHRWAGAWT